MSDLPRKNPAQLKHNRRGRLDFELSLFRALPGPSFCENLSLPMSSVDFPYKPYPFTIAAPSPFPRTRRNHRTQTRTNHIADPIHRVQTLDLFYSTNLPCNIRPQESQHYPNDHKTRRQNTAESAGGSLSTQKTQSCRAKTLSVATSICRAVLSCDTLSSI